MKFQENIQQRLTGRYKKSFDVYSAHLTSELGRHRRGDNLVSDYLFDVDVLTQLIGKNLVKFAKVKIGIIHLYCGNDIKKFIRKQKRRVKDYLYYQKIGVRKYPWHQQNKLGLISSF